MKLIVEHVESSKGNFAVRVSLQEETPLDMWLVNKMPSGYSSRTVSASLKNEVLAKAEVLTKVESLKKRILQDLGNVIRNNKHLFCWISQLILEENIELDQFLPPSP